MLTQLPRIQLQVREGIDAVIVDSVLAIRKGLTEAESRKKTTTTTTAENTTLSSSSLSAAGSDLESSGDDAGIVGPVPVAAKVSERVINGAENVEPVGAAVAAGR